MLTKVIGVGLLGVALVAYVGTIALTGTCPLGCLLQACSSTGGESASALCCQTCTQSGGCCPLCPDCPNCPCCVSGKCADCPGCECCLDGSCCAATKAAKAGSCCADGACPLCPNCPDCSCAASGSCANACECKADGSCCKK